MAGWQPMSKGKEEHQWGGHATETEILSNGGGHWVCLVVPWYVVIFEANIPSIDSFLISLDTILPVRANNKC